MCQSDSDKQFNVDNAVQNTVEAAVEQRARQCAVLF